MPGSYEFELSEPSSSRCDCCGGITVRLKRFVSYDADAFAVYFADYSNNHPDNEVAMLLSLGKWGEGSTPSQRAAFYCRVSPTDDSYVVMLGDAGESPWSDAEILGTKLTREQALNHPSKAEAFAILDEAFVRDPSLYGFLNRVHCGDVAVPLERTFALPDEVFALGEARERRAQISRNFVVLDGSRFFVRCLLRIPVEDYESWRVGLWVEVSKADYELAWNAWENEAQYPKLEFSGAIANDVTGNLGLPVPARTAVRVRVTEPDAPPHISPPATGELQALMTRPWPKAEFERFAISRGFL